MYSILKWTLSLIPHDFFTLLRHLFAFNCLILLINLILHFQFLIDPPSRSIIKQSLTNCTSLKSTTRSKLWTHCPYWRSLIQWSFNCTLLTLVLRIARLLLHMTLLINHHGLIKLMTFVICKKRVFKWWIIHGFVLFPKTFGNTASRSVWCYRWW